MNYIKDINLKNADGTYNMIIEIPKHTKNKYELLEPDFNKIKPLWKTYAKYPYYYGCFPRTLAGDRDPLDAILLSNKRRKQLDIVKVNIVGIIKTLDEGYVDNKVLVVASDEKINNLDKLKAQALKFLSVYKGKNANTQIDFNVYDIEDACLDINKAYISFLNRYEVSKNIVSF